VSDGAVPAGAHTPRTCVCPGTYDPPTHGHLDVIQRAATIFDRVIVGVVRSPKHKQPLLADAERVAFLEESLAEAGLHNVEVDTFSNLVVEFAADRGATVLVKGLRAISDFEWEFQMSRLNADLAPDIQTMYLMSDPRYAFISSSGVREIAAFGGDVSRYVSPSVAARLEQIRAETAPA
jgi:pantetheine-phosphate adenylyltransferase